VILSNLDSILNIYHNAADPKIVRFTKAKSITIGNSHSFLRHLHIRSKDKI